jgi:lambda repressor-like predicted transcriptional regulator
MKKNPDEKKIRAMLIMKGIRMTDIARELGLHHKTIHTIIHYYPTKKSRRVQEAIANALNKPFEKIWRHERKHNLTITKKGKVVND